MRTHQLNARRRRARKFQLAVRDGAHCAYCLAPFAHLKHATLDHVVPFHLLRTWSADHLVLACRPCNHAKADRFPLLIALLVIHAVDGVDAPAVHPDFRPLSTPDRSTAPVTGSGPVESGGLTVDRVDVHASTTVFTPGCWALLARLAHARHTADRTAPESGERSTFHQDVHGAHDRAHDTHGDVHGPVHHTANRTAVKSGGQGVRPTVHPGAHGAHADVHNAHERAHTPARRSSQGVREVDRSTRTHLCANPHESIRTPRRESA
ncbi:HNH endonuclease signature motif containing protein [Streptomyces sp. NPDC001674]|uniref:HNH endonuclease n=1 Tax=Streptomyces sp. NPDC001674 TaxID=3154394 RepID=UPI00332824BD